MFGWSICYNTPVRQMERAVVIVEQALVLIPLSATIPSAYALEEVLKQIQGSKFH